MKKIIILILVILISGIISLIILNKSTNSNNPTKEKNEPKQTEGITVVPTMQDKLNSDSSWCATFQLVWNDMKNEVVKKDIEFNPQEEFAKNLNLEEFTEDMLSEEYYYKTYGLKTLELKDQIEKGIQEKFSQKSDILDKFDWSEDGLNDPNNPMVKRYFFYTMLYREFEFLSKFDNLEKGKFGEEYTDVEYFGIDDKTKGKVGDQIDVLYYNSKDDFAIIINTKNNDEVIFCKNPKGINFKQIYENMNNEAEEYMGAKYFKDIDEFKAPKITFNVIKEYTELQNKRFTTANPNYPEAEILQAIQSIMFELDEKGGKIKSEAAIDVQIGNAVVLDKKEEPRYFYVDDTFTIFLREKGQELPYFAARIEDITKFQ